MVKRRCEEEELDGSDLEQVVGELSGRLAGPRSDLFIGETENVAFLLDLVRRTADKGESNSLLVLGPHGVGKTALVRRVLTLARDEIPAWNENVVVVQLNGLLQTDDRIALKEITKQLHLENVTGDRVFGSFAEHLTFLLASLKVGDKSSKPIVFILEEFDSFCSHKNQTLLYNLFDIAQSRAVPICVIGVSCQIDVTELLEKRVNSRFSHRHLNLMPSQEFEPFLQLATSLLLLEPAVEHAAAWNRAIQTFMKSKDVVKFLENRVFAYDKSITNLKRVLYLALLNMLESGAPKGATKLELTHLVAANDENFASEQTDACDLLIRDLSIVELCLLVAVKHITEIYDGEPFNFEMVFHEYVKFKRRKFTTLPEERSVVYKCWEQLLQLELVLPRPGDRIKGQQLEYVLNTFQLLDLRKAVEKYPHCPTEVLQWVKSNLHTSSH
jgi:origin recognition complex subunit 4